LIKSLIFEFLRLPGINSLLKSLRPVLTGFDMRAVDKFPVRGPMPIQFRGREVFRMASDGRDSAASGAFWVGLDDYEGCTLPVFAHLAAASRHIVDVGANTGIFSLLVARLYPTCRVHAFEPFPPAADLLEANIRLNALENVLVRRAALSDYNGNLPLFFNNALRLTQGASLQARSDRVNQVEVPVVRLDDYLPSEGISEIELLKIDVEGYEHQVLWGAEKTIATCRPHIICEVIRPEHYDKLRRFIQKHDYRSYRLAADGLHPDFELSAHGPVAWNRLFIHSSRLADLDGLPFPTSPRLEESALPLS